MNGKPPEPSSQIAALFGIDDMAGGRTDAIHIRRLARGVRRQRTAPLGHDAKATKDEDLGLHVNLAVDGGDFIDGQHARQQLVLRVLVNMAAIGQHHIHHIHTHHQAAIGVAAAAGLVAVQDRAGRKLVRPLITRQLKSNHLLRFVAHLKSVWCCQTLETFFFVTLGMID